MNYWGLYEKGKLCKPRKYSTGKTQEDVIREIIEAFESYEIVALKGAVGTGKSAIAAHVAAIVGDGKGIIVVPTKVLEDQYYRDYGGRKFEIRLNGRRVNFATVMGRSGFYCPFNGGTAARHDLPCTVPLTHKSPVGNVIKLRRIDVASKCPHWCPIVDSALLGTYKRELDDIRTIYSYGTVVGNRHIILREEQPCGFYKQFFAYASNCIIMMNSAIWEVETMSGRKPYTSIEVIDEADAWLDSLSMERALSVNTINRLIDRYSDDKVISRKLDEMLVDLTNLITKYDGYTGEITDEWINFIKEYSATFDEIHKEASIAPLLGFNTVWMSVDATRSKVRFFIPDLHSVFHRFRERMANRILLMSATFPPEEVLKDVFGIDEICFIEGESKFPGTIYLRKTGKEDYVSHQKWRDENFRKKYYDCLNEIIDKAKRPLLIHVHSKKYLPEDKINERLRDRAVFEEGFDEAWSTIAKRGVDLPGNKCRAICVLKHPFADLSDGMIQAIRLKLGDDKFFKYYRDMATRELIQQVGRAVRSDDDWVEVWSPDLTVHNVLLNAWKGRIVKYGQMQI